MIETIDWVAAHWRFVSLFITVILGMFGGFWKLARIAARIELQLKPNGNSTPHVMTQKRVVEPGEEVGVAEPIIGHIRRPDGYMTIREEVDELRTDHHKLHAEHNRFMEAIETQWGQHREQHRELINAVRTLTGIVRREHPDPPAFLPDEGGD